MGMNGALICILSPDIDFAGHRCRNQGGSVFLKETDTLRNLGYKGFSLI